MSGCGPRKRRTERTLTRRSSGRVWIRRAAFAAATFSLVAIGASVDAAGTAAATGPVLVVVAHPDDEALGMAGIIKAAVDASRTVYVAVVTNGDASQSGGFSGYCGASAGDASSTARYGLTRDGETIAGMGLLGLSYTTTVTASRIFFFGYPDLSLATISTATTPWTGDATGLHRTYAEDGDGNVSTCNGDLGYLATGGHSAFTAAALAADFDRLFGLTQPTDVYTHVSFDGHPDHAEVYRQVVAAIQRAGRPVTLHGTLMHPENTGGCMSFSATQWPNPPEANNNPFARFTPGLDVAAPPIPACSSPSTGSSWGPKGAPNELVQVPTSMQASTEASNLKWQVISSYASQVICVQTNGVYHPSCGYMRAFVKQHEFFWTESFSPTPPAAPTNTSPPTISGAAQQGQTLSASSGTWTGSPTSYAYQWRRCDATGGACASISGASAQSYLLGASDVGFTIRVRVSATNAGGSTSADSAASALVSAAPSSTNLCLNPSFETNPVEYTFYGSGTATWASDAAHTGSLSAKLVTTDGSLNRWTQSFSVTPGQHYQLATWVKTSSGSGSLAASFWNGGTYSGVTYETQGVSGDWQRIALTVTVPSGVDRMRLELRSAFTAGVRWFDDVEAVLQ